MNSTWNFIGIEPFEYTQTGIGPVGKSFDVFGDGKIVLVNTPGRSHGMFSAKISNGEKYVILAGDTVYTQKSMQERIIPGYQTGTQVGFGASVLDLGTVLLVIIMNNQIMRYGNTVLSTYYLQSIMHGKMSMAVSVLRSAVISGLFLILLPVFLNIFGVWIAMPISEFIVAIIALFYIWKKT